jgi:hypothetical protein
METRRHGRLAGSAPSSRHATRDPPYLAARADARLDHEKNLIRWTWRKYPEYAKRYRQAVHDPDNAHLRFARLSSEAEIDRLLA